MEPVVNIVNPSNNLKAFRVFSFPGVDTPEAINCALEKIHKRHMASDEILVLDVLQPASDLPESQLILGIADTLKHGGGILVILKSNEISAAAPAPSPASRLTPWEASRWVKKT